ncbi:hypothetical+protein [Methylocapsa aurea]|uniref:hypothetical protein n=1 Tax=Methylocapsa aurea TaxID=663610 RepID=UPI003D1879ED
MTDIITADADALHWPARAHCLQSLEEHANRAARLARALFIAIDGLDSGTDDRDKMALFELASDVADHATATVYAFNLEHDRRRAEAEAAHKADSVVFEKDERQ